MRYARAALLPILCGGVLGPLAAQGNGGMWVGQVQAAATTASAPFVGAGLGGGVRSRGRSGAYVTVNAGSSGNALAFRGELAAVFHLDPARRAGWAAYGGGGVALEWSDSRSAQYVLLLVGIEAAPRASRGWFAELGVGGGLRAAAGYRLRRLPSG